MKKTFALCIACLMIGFTSALAAVNIIPKPTSVVERQGAFQLRNGLTIGYNDASLQPAAAYLQDMLTRATALRIKTGKKGRIQLMLLAPDPAIRRVYSSSHIAIEVLSTASPPCANCSPTRLRERLTFKAWRGACQP